MEMNDIFKEIKDNPSFNTINPAHTPEYEAKLKETVDLLTNAKGFASHKRAYMIREALTTSDFPALFGDVLYRQLLGKYNATPPVWKQFVKSGLLNDFRTSYRFRIWGGESVLDAVPQETNYPLSKRSEIRYAIAAKKYGREFDIDWESIVSDDLGALQDTPERFAKAATRTEHYLVTSKYANNVGTHMVETTPWTEAALFQKATTPTAANCVATALAVESLTTAYQAMLAFVDQESSPINNAPKYLVVPPALQLTAQKILTSAWVQKFDSDNAYPVANALNNLGLQLVVDPWLPIIDTTNGQTGWYLFADPAEIPVLEFDHLQGHEVPEIAMKASNKIAVGGAPMSPMSGDFDNDTIKYRVRIVAGVTKLDWRGCYMGGAVS